MHEAGELIGRGREADVHLLPDGTVLRRLNHPHDVAHDAEAMRYASSHGFPVPQVFRAEGQDLVMEFVPGRTMLAELGDGTCSIEDAALVLADLLARLRALPTRPGAPAGTGLVHLDLHPDNVLMGPTGPVVIDWTNARDSDRDLDPAFSALIIAQAALGELAEPAKWLLDLLLRALHERGMDPRRRLDLVLQIRLDNPTMSAEEIEALPAAARLVLDGADRLWATAP